MEIILASQSPRRRELLAQIGLLFAVKPSHIDESGFAGLQADKLVEALSRAKAEDIAKTAPEDTLVIGSDTVVTLDGEILGKPGSEEEAVKMLTALSGRSHSVYTGVTVCGGGRSVTRSECTQVTFRSLNEAEIRSYVRSGEPMDKAGAYGIQGLGALLIEGIRGDYFNVVGLPINCLRGMLAEFGVDCLAEAGKK